MKSILSIGVIAVCIGVYFVYIKPLTVDIKVLSAKKSEYENVLNRVKEIDKKRDAIDLEYNSISEIEIDRLKKIIPEKLNSVFLLNNLSTIGQKYGITISDFKTTELDTSSGDGSGEVSNNPYKTTSISMSLNGQYEQFLSFIKEVELSLSLIDVVTLGIRPIVARDGQSMNMDFKLEANTYSLR